jgi:hypothetical protein
MHFSRRVSPLLSLLMAGMLICSSLPAQAREFISPFDFQALQQQPATVTKEYVDTKSPKTSTFSRKESVNGVHRVGIVGFHVVFSEVVVEQTNGSTLNEIRNGNWSDNRWELQVKNITPQVRQQVTEQIYREFQEQMAQQGFEVVPHEQIANSANYQAFVQETLTRGKHNDDLTSNTQRATKFGKNTVWSVVPEGFPLERLDVNSDIFAGAKPSFMDGMKQIGAGFAQTGETKAKSRAYQDFSDFTPIAVTYYVDFKKLKAIGGFLPGNPFGSSAKDSTFGLSISPGSHVRFFTRVGENQTAYSANYQLNFILKKPVQNVDPVGLVRFEGQNFGAQALGFATNIAMRQMGVSSAIKVRKVREYEMQVEPSLFSSQASKLLRSVNQMMSLAIATETQTTPKATPAPAVEPVTTSPVAPEESPAAEEAQSSATNADSPETLNSPAVE